jgi:hypothetical protein
MALQAKEISDLYGSLKTLLEIWMRIKLAIQRAFTGEAPTADQEQAFLKLKSELSRLYRTVGEKLPPDLKFEGEAMIEMMKNATSMKNLQAVPVAEKRNMFSKWHRFYVLMTRSFGAMEVMNEGYHPRLHRERLKTKDNKSSKSKGKTKK